MSTPTLEDEVKDFLQSSLSDKGFSLPMLLKECELEPDLHVTDGVGHLGSKVVNNYLAFRRGTTETIFESVADTVDKYGGLAESTVYDAVHEIMNLQPENEYSKKEAREFVNETSNWKSLPFEYDIRVKSVQELVKEELDLKEGLYGDTKVFYRNEEAASEYIRNHLVKNKPAEPMIEKKKPVVKKPEFVRRTPQTLEVDYNLEDELYEYAMAKFYLVQRLGVEPTLAEAALKGEPALGVTFQYKHNPSQKGVSDYYKDQLDFVAKVLKDRTR